MWGDNKKYGALRLDVGNFSWGSACCTHKTRITDIVYNTSNDEPVHTKTLVQNCIMLTNNTWYAPLCPAPGPQEGAKLTPEEEETLNKKQSKKIQKKYEERKKNTQISRLLEQGSPAVCNLLGTGPHSRRWVSKASSAAPHHSHYCLKIACITAWTISPPPPPRSAEKLSSTKPVPGAKKLGDHCSRRAVLAGQASCMHHFKTRPVWSSRWLCARGQGAGILSEEYQGPEKQINPPPSYLISCKKGVYCYKKNDQANKEGRQHKAQEKA